MNKVDSINGMFEFLGAILLFRNCMFLHRDKYVKGVSIFTTGFFTVWGVWNIYFYSALNQWFSLAGGILLVSANAIWVGMAIYYGVVNDRNSKAV